MQIAGTHSLHMSPNRAWQLLNDPEVLARITPGVKKLEPDGPDRFKAELELAVGPVRGSFEGHVEVRDKQEPSQLTLHVEGQGRAGGIVANGRIKLAEDNGDTLVNYEGDAHIAGRLAAVGSRLFSGVARRLATLFFQKLEEEGSSDA